MNPFKSKIILIENKTHNKSLVNDCWAMGTFRIKCITHSLSSTSIGVHIEQRTKKNVEAQCTLSF